MIAVSLIINTALFFLLLNMGYFRRRRQDPACPEKPFHQLYLFPLALGVVFTLIVDSFRGIVIYQMIIFLAAALLLYWIFYVMSAQKR
jgi:multisubunit Na+/H+ antiporter MnhC subunit